MYFPEQLQRWHCSVISLISPFSEKNDMSFLPEFFLIKRRVLIPQHFHIHTQN
jgi:hypothetical protein